MTKSVLAYVGAAFAEIGGCFAFWAWLRLGKSLWWVVPGLGIPGALRLAADTDRQPARRPRLCGIRGRIHHGLVGLVVDG